MDIGGWGRREGKEEGGDFSYRLNMSDIISTSVSAFAIFSAEESWGLPPKRKDMVAAFWDVELGRVAVEV